MVTADVLFEFTFNSRLLIPQIRQLASTTGMRIGDVHNPYKDTPGKGSFAGNVSIFLAREEPDGSWAIRTYSDDLAGTDLSAVADLRRRLRQLLPTIATEWAETYTFPALVEPRAQDQESQEKVSVSRS